MCVKLSDLYNQEEGYIIRDLCNKEEGLVMIFSNEYITKLPKIITKYYL